MACDEEMLSGLLNRLGTRLDGDAKDDDEHENEPVVSGNRHDPGIGPGATGRDGVASNASMH